MLVEWAIGILTPPRPNGQARSCSRLRPACAKRPGFSRSCASAAPPPLFSPPFHPPLQSAVPSPARQRNTLQRKVPTPPCRPPNCRSRSEPNCEPQRGWRG